MTRPGPARPAAVTLKEVAARAGVSLATASRVLSGSSATTQATREKVEAAARALNFQPNAQARSLRSLRTNTIGVLISDVRNTFFADIARAVEHEALGRGFVTILGNANENTAQQDRYLDAFVRQRVDGLIVAPQGDGTGALEQVLERRVPLVFVDRTVPAVAVPSVTTNSRPGMVEAMRYLQQAGHTRIGCIAGPQVTSTGRERLALFREALADQHLPYDPDLVALGNFQAASGAAAVQQLMRLEHPPTAIVAADSPMAVGAVARLHELGLRPGDDLELIAFDDADWFLLLDPPLNVIAHSATDMGARALALLLDVMAGRAAESVCLDSSLIIRSPRTLNDFAERRPR